MILQSSGAVPLPDGLFRPGPTLWVQDFFGPRFELAFRAVSELGISWGLLFAAGVALWTWGRRDAYALAGMAAVSAAASVVMNWLFYVPRPSHPSLIEYEQVDLGSFPSGHVFLATVLWGVLFARGRVSGWLLAAVIAGVSLSRLFLGVHYLADVVGGALLALAVVAAYHPLWKRLEPRLRAWSPAVFVAFGVLVVVGLVAGAFLGVYGDNPYQWRSVGVAAGGAAALLLERRFVGYEPAPAGAAGRLAWVGLGLAGLAALSLVDHAGSEDAFLRAAALTAAGALWALLAVPFLLRRRRIDVRG